MRILFITSGRIGDAVLSTGLLAHLAEAHPGARITVACGPAPAALFRSCPLVERVIAMPKKKRAGHWLELWRSTVGTLWHLVVDLRGSAISFVIPAMRRRVLRQSWAPEHRLAHLAKVLSLPHPAPPVLWATPADEAEAARLIPTGGPVLAVGPTANWAPKQWPAERFAAALARLTAADGILPGARVAVFGAANERDAARAVIDSAPAGRCLDLVGAVDLPTAYAALRRCAFYLGNDSGLMHMAAASGVPTLGLFGPSSEVFYGPWGPACAALRGPRSFEDICHDPAFDHRHQDSLMLDLKVDTVVDSATALYARTAARAP